MIAAWSLPSVTARAETAAAGSRSPTSSPSRCVARKAADALPTSSPFRCRDRHPRATGANPALSTRASLSPRRHPAHDCIPGDRLVRDAQPDGGRYPRELHLARQHQHRPVRGRTHTAVAVHTRAGRGHPSLRRRPCVPSDDAPPGFPSDAPPESHTAHCRSMTSYTQTRVPRNACHPPLPVAP
eukprot:6152377-Prymnesium_polylepis.2